MLRQHVVSPRGRFGKRVLVVPLATAACVALAITGGCTGSIGDPSDDNGKDAAPICTDGSLHPGDAPIRRMTSFEYDNTVYELLGDTTHPAASFPKEEEALGFNNNAANLTVSDDLADKYMRAAEGISLRATTNLGTLTGCSTFDDACAAAFIDAFGKRAFRRPLDADERTGLQQVFQAGKTQSASGDATADFTQGVQMVIEAALQSPEFLYRVEPVDPDAEKDKVVALDSYEMASRLSYFLWASMPDENLFAAADADALTTKEAIATQARRMLADPRARNAVGQFHEQWLDYERIQGVTKDASLFPDWSPAVGALMQEETRQFIEHTVFDDGGDLTTLLTASYTYANADLATFYGLPTDGLGADFAKVQFDPKQHAGLLTLGSLMAWYAHSNQTSPVLRGKLVREQFLCDTLNPPPNNFKAPTVDPNATTRERFAQHSTDPACKGCHGLMDGLGFGLENIDSVGRFRSTENDVPIDSSGNIIESDVDGTFDGAVELAGKLASSNDVERCYATQWFRWTEGRGETIEDNCSMDQIDQAFDKSHGNIEELIVALTQTDAFLFRKNGEMP